MIQGMVVHGDHIGKTLGYPTANLDVPAASVHLSDGVYAAKAWLNHTEYPAALVINGDQDKVEAHLIGYTGDDFYGSVVPVEPIQKISERKQFSSIDELKEKIAADLVIIQDIV